MEKIILERMMELTSPATAAVVVAMAGTILPAISFVLNRSTVSMEYIVALRFYRTQGVKSETLNLVRLKYKSGT